MEKYGDPRWLSLCLPKPKRVTPGELLIKFRSSAGNGYRYLIFSLFISLLTCSMLPGKREKIKSFEKRGHAAKAQERGAKSSSVISSSPHSQEVEKTNLGQEVGAREVK